MQKTVEIYTVVTQICTYIHACEGHCTGNCTHKGKHRKSCPQQYCLWCQDNFLTATHIHEIYKMWTILNVFVIQLLSDNNTHTAHTPPLQVMTAARLIIFNPRFQGGYRLKVMTTASNCFRGVTNLFVEKTSKPAPRMSCSLLIMATALWRLTPNSGSICLQFEQAKLQNWRWFGSRLDAILLKPTQQQNDGCVESTGQTMSWTVHLQCL